jgi:hypothetical protein
MLLNRRGRRWPIGVSRPRGSSQLSISRADAIVRDSAAVWPKILSGWIGTAGLVTPFEEAAGVEGAAAVEVLFAAVCAEGPQRHCDVEDRLLI